MSAKARQYEASLSRIIHDAGARIVERGVDGSSHRTLTFQLHGQRRTIHFPSTGTSRGHGLKNTQQRLKWLLAAIPEPVDLPLPTVQPAEPVPASLPTIEAALPELIQPEKPRRRRMSKEYRREIARSYIAGTSFEELAAEHDLPVERIITLLLAQRGDAAHRCQRELTKRRMEMARRRREEVAVKPRLALRALDSDTRRKLAKQAAKLFFREGMTAAETAERLNVSPSAAYTLAREYA